MDDALKFALDWMNPLANKEQIEENIEKIKAHVQKNESEERIISIYGNEQLDEDLKKQMIKMAAGMPDVVKTYFETWDGMIYTETKTLHVEMRRFDHLKGKAATDDRNVEFNSWTEVTDKLSRIDFLNQSKNYSDYVDQPGKVVITLQNGRQFYLDQAWLCEDDRGAFASIKKYDPISDKFLPWKSIYVGKDIKAIVFPKTVPVFCNKCGSFFPPAYKYCPYDKTPLK